MKVSIKWIKELLPSLEATADEIADRLGQSGFEIEAREDLGAKLANVVVAEVRALEPHPDADKLRVAQVFDGEGVRTVVCGAPNVAAGQKVALARLGASLPNGMNIERRKVRGVESEGMLCSEAELGLSEAHDGIIVLKPKAKPGKPIAEALELEDVILEVAVTPNRPDALSHFGLARELAALFGLPMPKASVKLTESKAPAASAAKVSIRDLERCPTYAARVLTGVKIGPSPAWVARRLRAIGQRPISNVVDATNLVLFELGHPLHAFDLDKVGGHEIIVRKAAVDEKLTTLDGQVRTLSDDDLVIADANAAVALAGVMGGGDSEVSEGTVNLLLESALFDPRSVRRTSKRHGLHTEASHRFERGADRAMVEVAVDRCAELIVELAGGQVSKGRILVEGDEPAAKLVPVRPERASRVLGREVTEKEAKRALKALGLKHVRALPKLSKKTATDADKALRAKHADSLWFEVPSWRVDLSREEDLIEEIARLGGFDAIPTIMPPGSPDFWTRAPTPDPERKLREVLAGEGFLETVALAFNARREVELFGFDGKKAVEVANPLGEESALMRMSMLPALCRAARHNQDVLPSITDLRLFEVGKTFAWDAPPGKLPVETHEVGLLMRGHRVPQTWAAKDAKGNVPMIDAFDVKAAIESVLSAFRVAEPAWLPEDTAWLHPRSGTRLELDGKVLGVFGELHPDVMAKLGLEGAPVFVATLAMDAIVAAQGGHAAFTPLPKLPPAQRDLSFFIGRDVPASRVLAVIRGAATSLESVDIFDVYEGQGLPEGKRSLAVTMVLRAARTLTDAEIEAGQGAIVKALASELGAELRSK